MRKIVLFLHTSLDGYLAGTNGEMDWIRVDDEIFDYAGSQTDLADTALYGRVTYEMMEGYWPIAGDQPNASKHDIQHSAWYNNVLKVVMSNTMKDKELSKTKFISGDIQKQVLDLKQQAGNNIIMFGSPSAAHELMRHDLIDEYWLFVNPVLLGSGIPLFKNIQNRTALKLSGSKTFSCGVVMLRYVI